MNAEEAREIYIKTQFHRLIRRVEERSADGIRNASIEFPMDFTAREVSNVVTGGFW